MSQRPIPQKETRGAPGGAADGFPDAELLQQVKAGHTEAFGELVRRYQDRVFNTCWRICGHLEDARDLTQEAFLKVYENLALFRQESAFYTWVFRVAVNLALSHRRKVKRHRQVQLDEGEPVGSQAEGLLRIASRPADGPAESVVAAETLAGVLQALQAVSEEQRAVIVLRDLEGFDYHEIGLILEIPPGTVRSRLHRAREELRRLMLPAMRRKK